MRFIKSYDVDSRFCIVMRPFQPNDEVLFRGVAIGLSPNLKDLILAKVTVIGYGILNVQKASFARVVHRNRGLIIPLTPGDQGERKRENRS